MPRADVVAPELGERLKALRKSLGWDQKDLARELGKSLSAIQQLEQGRNWNKYVDLAEIAAKLHTTPNYLLNVDSASELKLGLAAVHALLRAEGWAPERARALIDRAGAAVEGFLRQKAHEGDAESAVRALALFQPKPGRSRE